MNKPDTDSGNFPGHQDCWTFPCGFQKFVNRRDFFSGETLGQQRHHFRVGVETSEENEGCCGQSVLDSLEKVHVLRESCDGTRHVGRVVNIPHGPVDVGEAEGSRNEQGQRGVLLVSQIIGGLVTQQGNRD